MKSSEEAWDLYEAICAAWSEAVEKDENIPRAGDFLEALHRHGYVVVQKPPSRPFRIGDRVKVLKSVPAHAPYLMVGEVGYVTKIGGVWSDDIIRVSDVKGSAPGKGRYVWASPAELELVEGM